MKTVATIKVCVTDTQHRIYVHLDSEYFSRLLMDHLTQELGNMSRDMMKQEAKEEDDLISLLKKDMNKTLGRISGRI